MKQILSFAAEIIRQAFYYSMKSRKFKVEIFFGYKQLKCLPAHVGLNNQEHMVSKEDVQKYRYIQLFSVVTGTADFIKKVQSFNDDYLSIPECPGTMNYPKKPGFNLYQSRHCAYKTYSLKTWF